MTKFIVSVFALLLLAGCATVRKVESGVNAVGDRLSFNLQGPWNHIDFPAISPGQMWTMEGVYVDSLTIYSGLKSGDRMHPRGAGGGAKEVTFSSSMTRDELVAMFEGVLVRDGSAVSLRRISPTLFGGVPGLLFEFERVVKETGLRQFGFGYAAVSEEELFAMVYVAPALTFFSRHKSRVEEIARTARIKQNNGSLTVSDLKFVSVNIGDERPSSGVAGRVGNAVPKAETLNQATSNSDAQTPVQATSKKLKSSEPIRGSSKETIEKRLAELKRLYEKGLVSKKNYLDQQKRLLDLLN